MGLGAIGLPGLILILIVALIVFGPAKLPEIGKAAGDTLREFKKATSDVVNDNNPNNKETDNQSK